MLGEEWREVSPGNGHQDHGAELISHSRNLLGPRAAASPRPSPLTRGVPRESSLPIPCPCTPRLRTGTLDPSLPLGLLGSCHSPAGSPGLTSPPRCPHLSLHAGKWDRFGQGCVLPRPCVPGHSGN